MSEQFRLRPARKDDARSLALLIDIAGEGFGQYLWAQSAGPGEEPLGVGMKRARREEGGFSYRNATLAEIDGRVAGLLLGYRLNDPYDTGGLGSLPAMIRPLVELESCAPGSWYINALAAFPEYRGRGLGTFLLNEADRRARAAGAKSVSLIVAEENAGAVRLYRRIGYLEAARRRLVPFPGLGHAGDWVLMVRPL
jgi:ribosomal protein S18 acetylase RimI-like enzyme